MADNADIANDLVLERMELHLAARQPAQPVMVDDCESCGEPIPADRLAALAARGCVRCLGCQVLHERRGGGR